MNREKYCIIVICCAILMASGCATSGEQLDAAAAKGDSTHVKLILDKNPELKVDPHTLNVAAASGDLESVHLLVERGADVNAQESVEVWDRGKSVDGGAHMVWSAQTVPNASKPAIAYAIANHHVAVAKYLLEHGASVSLRFVEFDSLEVPPTGGYGAFGHEWRWATIQQVAQESGDPDIIRLVGQK